MASTVIIDISDNEIDHKAKFINLFTKPHKSIFSSLEDGKTLIKNFE